MFLYILLQNATYTWWIIYKKTLIPYDTWYILLHSFHNFPGKRNTAASINKTPIYQKVAKHERWIVLNNNGKSCSRKTSSHRFVCFDCIFVCIALLICRILIIIALMYMYIWLWKSTYTLGTVNCSVRTIISTILFT